MINNYLKIALRSLIKNRLTTLINIFGLAIGLSGSIFIGLYVIDELQYDRHYKSKDSIFRLSTTFELNGTKYQSATTKGNVGPNLLQKFQEVESAVRLLAKDEVFLFSENKAFKEEIIYSDAGFTSVFDPVILSGNKQKCLANPSSIIISRSMAEKLFGEEWRKITILGKVLSIDGRIPMTITGVFDDFPDQSHFKSHLFATVPTGQMDWIRDDSKVYTYILLRPNAVAENIAGKLNSHSGIIGQNQLTDKEKLILQPLTDLHFSPSLADENSEKGNLKNIYALLLVGTAMILITVTNFVNLYTAGSFNRLKEVGVRKALGALRIQVRIQFLLETLLITSFSMMVATLLVMLGLGEFNWLTSKNLSFNSLLQEDILLLFCGMMFVIPLLAGLYPSFYLSGVHLIKAHKGKNTHENSILNWRKGLIILQFSISAIMITLSIVAYRQVGLINNMPLGFNKENTVALSNPYMLGSLEKIVGFKNELLALPGVERVSVTGYTPSQKKWVKTNITFPGRDRDNRLAQATNWLTVDDGFIETMGLTLTQGRNFSKIHESDKESIIINETASRRFNFNTTEQGPIGSELSYSEGPDSLYSNYKVIGVVKDFNFGSLHENINPLVMKLGYHRFEMVIRLSPNLPKHQTLNLVNGLWKKKLPEIPFQYSFIKERFDRMHKADTITSKIFAFFCLITIALSGFGLFSIVAFSIINRTKEIGIRKVLGASEVHVAFLLISDFQKLIWVSFVISLPIASFVSQKWINDFVYKTEVNWWIYALTALVLLSISIMTLGIQSIRASRANPVNNLRHD
jgi:putative ABC transport system permease protein